MLVQHLEGSYSPVQPQFCCDIRAKCTTAICMWLVATFIVCWVLRWFKRHRERLRSTHDMRCTICLSLLYRPVTLLCGHTACESCCAAWFHQSDLPVEERVCFSGCGARHGCLLPNVTLYMVEQLEQQYPQEYAQRRTDPAIAKYNDLIKRYRAMSQPLTHCSPFQTLTQI
jgi:RING-type zinc-finger